MGILEHVKNNAQKRREAPKLVGPYIHIMDMAASKLYQVLHPRPISIFLSLFENGLPLKSRVHHHFSYQSFHFDPFWGVQNSLPKSSLPKL